MIVIKKLTLHSVVFVLASWALPSLAHQGSHNNEPTIVCKEKKLSDQCEYNNHAGDIYRGTCRSFSNTLMCVRNKPVVKAKTTEVKKSIDQHEHEHEHVENNDMSATQFLPEKSLTEK